MQIIARSSGLIRIWHLIRKHHSIRTGFAKVVNVVQALALPCEFRGNEENFRGVRYLYHGEPCSLGGEFEMR